MPPSSQRQQRVTPGTGRGTESKQAADGEDRVGTPAAGDAAKPNPRGRGLKKEAQGIEVRILERSFRIACSEDEKADLLKAVEYLDHKMREIQDGGKAVGVERIAIMAALNITHELLSVRVGGFDVGEFKRRMQSTMAAIDQALAAQDELF
jgi:cell division protein ZapA